MTPLRVLERAVDLDHGDHVAWVYDDRAGLRAAAVDAFAEGAARGEQMLYIGDRSPEDLREDLAALEGRDALLESGRLQIHHVAELYQAGGTLDPSVQVEMFRAEAQRAVHQGFTGLRVVGEVSEIVADPVQQAAFVDYELALEALFAATPVTGICAFDRKRLGERSRELAALHRLQHVAGHDPTFALTYASGVVRLFGELDAASTAEFERLLDAVLASTSGVVEVNLDELRFIDVSASRVLAVASQVMTCADRALLLTGVGRSAVLPLAAFNLHGGAHP